MPNERTYLTEAEAPTREALEEGRGLVLLEFGTPGCGYCRAMAPYIGSFLQHHPEVQHVLVEDGPGRRLGRSFGVVLWPSFVLLRDGVVISEMARPGKAELDQALTHWLNG